MFQFDVAANLSILTKYLQQITTSWKHRHFLETPTFLLTTRRMIFWSEPGPVLEVQEEVDKHTGQPGATARRWGCCARSRWRLQGLLRPLLPRNWTRGPVLCTVATLPGAAAREIRAWDEVAKSCVDRRATDAPDAETITGRLQELGAQYRAPILPGALTLTLASRAPPRVSWSTTFKRGLTVVRGLGILCL